jgi:hypothetical protein
MAAIELAALVLPAADTAANHRETFIDVMGLDPGLVGRGQGRRAARILSAVLAALREHDRTPGDAAAGHEVPGDQRDQQHGEEGERDEHRAGDGELRHDVHGALRAVRHPL